MRPRRSLLGCGSTGDAQSNIGSFFFAIAANGKQTRIVGTTPGTTVTGESIRQ